MKVLIIGGVAAGTKTAAKLKRLQPGAEVTIITKGKDISYAGCGLPYYVGNVIKERSELIVNTPAKFEALTGTKVLNGTEVVSVDRSAKTIHTINADTQEEAAMTYDKLVVAVGARPVSPQFPGLGLKNVFFMRTPDDADGLRKAVDSGEIRRATVVGGGFIGLEIAENLASRGVRASVVEMADQILPGFDPEIAGYIENILADNGIMCFTGTSLVSILGTQAVEKIETSKRTMKTDAVILSIGIRPNTEFLKDSGIELNQCGLVVVDDNMRTNDPDVYSVGDCALVTNLITGERAWSPMGSSANIEGRICARSICGADAKYRGAMGTAVCKLSNVNVGKTGLSELAAIAAGYDVVTCSVVTDDKAHYYPGAGSFTIKLIADRATRFLLGVQVVGAGNVDKIVDIAVTAISMKATVNDLEDLDFAYAPPFSTAIHPFAVAINVLNNKLDGLLDSITPAEYLTGAAEGYTVVDAAITPTIKGAPYVDLTRLGGAPAELDKDGKYLLVCTKGKRAYMLQQQLKHLGYKNTKVLETGIQIISDIADANK